MAIIIIHFLHPAIIYYSGSKSYQLKLGSKIPVLASLPEVEQAYDTRVFAVAVSKKEKRRIFAFFEKNVEITNIKRRNHQ
jgi:hypothetical protein